MYGCSPLESGQQDEDAWTVSLLQWHLIDFARVDLYMDGFVFSRLGCTEPLGLR